MKQGNKKEKKRKEKTCCIMKEVSLGSRRFPLLYKLGLFKKFLNMIRKKILLTSAI